MILIKMINYKSDIDLPMIVFVHFSNRGEAMHREQAVPVDRRVLSAVLERGSAADRSQAGGTRHRVA